MTFFTPDLYRHLGIGFLLGTALLAAINADDWADQISPPAQAAEVAHVPQPSPEFLVQPAR